LDRQQSKDRWLTREFIFIFNELEKVHKCRFSDISKQVRAYFYDIREVAVDYTS